MSPPGAVRPWPAVDDDAVEALRRRLAAVPAAATARERWDAVERADWPALFRLIDAGEAKELAERPAVPAAADVAPIHDAASAAAARELAAVHCVHVDGLVDAAGRADVDVEVARLAPERAGTWGEVARDAAPDLFAPFDAAVASDAFRRLTGYDPATGRTTLTLSLQSLDPAGIAWHRDLYWPKEWVGRDVFAVLYALGDDTPEKGGAFLLYDPWTNRVTAAYRRRHQATILWNAADPDGRLLHAVSAYHGDDTARHLVILQCLRG